MRSIKKIVGCLLLLAMVMGLSLTGFAGEPEPENPPAGTGNGTDENKYEGDVGNLKDVVGTSFTFNKFLIIGAGDQVPNVTFEYTIEAGTDISLDTSENPVMQVNAGIMTGIAQPTDTEFVPGDETFTTVQQGHADVTRAASDRLSGLTAATGVEFETAKGEKYAVKESTIDFSGVTFVEPGIYRYIIKETESTAHEAAGIMHDNDISRVLDVYVTDNGSGELKIANYVLHKGAGETGAWIDNPNVRIGTDMGSADVTTPEERLADKTDGFTNEYKSYDLVFKKEVYGNQASRDKFFKMTLKVADLNGSDKFVVSLSDDGNTNTTDGSALATSGSNNATIAANQGKTNVQEVTGDQLAAGVDFYLQHGNYIAVRGLPANANYTLTENAEDYKSEAAPAQRSGAKIVDYQNATSGVISTEDGRLRSDGVTTDTAPDHVVYTSYLNVRDGIIPTGILSVIGPAIAVIVVAGIGIAAVVISKRKKRAHNG